MFLEPLRDPAYNMGEKGYWSWFWSIVFVLIGTLLLAANHIVRYYIKKKKNVQVQFNDKRSVIFGAIFLVLGIALIVSGIVLMTSEADPHSISYCKYNMGLISLIIGVSFAVISGVPIFNLINSKNANKEVANEQI